MNSDKKIYDFVKEHYQKYLEREPDTEGLEYYFLQIKHNRLKPKDLRYILQQSDEYKKKLKRKNYLKIFLMTLKKF